MLAILQIPFMLTGAAGERAEAQSCSNVVQVHTREIGIIQPQFSESIVSVFLSVSQAPGRTALKT